MTTEQSTGGQSHSAFRAASAHVETRAMQTLMGMVTGIVSDAHLHDNEIALLNTWLTEHFEAANHWPGCVITAQLRSILADGIVTAEERAHLLTVLTELANNDFANTGSASAEPLQLPIDDNRPVSWPTAGVVHTGNFMYGTRAKCERLTMALGAMPLDNVTKSADVLVIGARVSPHWVNESYGRKIMRAVELRDSGHPIRIVSERFWFDQALAAGKAQQ